MRVTIVDDVSRPLTEEEQLALLAALEPDGVYVAPVVSDDELDDIRR